MKFFSFVKRNSKQKIAKEIIISKLFFYNIGTYLIYIIYIIIVLIIIIYDI